MKDKYILTAESVTAGHPDKLCDTIADSVLDACLKEDPNARVACEVLATAGKILVAGELRTTASPDVETIVRQTVQRAGYDCNYHVEVRLHTQSPDIADAVDGETLGAGDQGIMYGYACWETVELLPAPVVLANRITSLLTTCREEKLISGIGPDGKAQVSVQYAFGVPERVDTIVISCQHDADKDPDELREELRRLVIARACHDVRIDEQTKIFINPSGRFVLGGFEADTGLTGRKLMVDTYGGLVPHGGGALSGMGMAEAFYNAADKSGLWTLSVNGDGGTTFFVKGEFVTDNETVALSHDDCYNLTKVDMKDFGSPDMQHFECGGV